MVEEHNQAQAAEETQAARDRIYVDLPARCFSKPRVNSSTGEEFCDVYLPKGFEIAGADIDGNDLSGRDLGDERFYISQTIKKDDMQFVRKSQFYEGGRRFTHNPEYPITLKSRVQDPITEEWSDGPTFKVDADTFDAALKDWQFAKDDEGRNINVITLQVPREMVHEVETKDGSFYNIDCPDTTIDRIDVSGMQFTVGNVRELPWDQEGVLYGINAFAEENIRASNPENREEGVWVSAKHANMAYKDDRARVQQAAQDKSAPGAKHAATNERAQAKTMDAPTPQMDAPVPTPRAVR